MHCVNPKVTDTKLSCDLSIASLNVLGSTYVGMAIWKAAIVSVVNLILGISP
jgi:hypothetical protein